MQTMFMAKQPPPPTPWNARRIILCRAGQQYDLGGGVRSPNIQLVESLGCPASTGEDGKESQAKHQDGLSTKDVAQLGENNDQGDVAKEVAGHDPARIFIVSNICRDVHDCGSNDGKLHEHHEESEA